MAITLSTKGRLAIKQQAAWGTPETSFAATDYLEVESPFIPVLAREAIRANVYQPGYTESEIMAGSKSPTELTFRMPLHGWSTATPSADPTIHPDALLFKLALGDAGGDGYSTANLGGGSNPDEGTTYTNADAAWCGYAISYPTAGLRAVAWLNEVDLGAMPDTASFIAATARDVITGTAYGSFVAWLSNTAQLPATVDWFGSDANAHIRYSDGLPPSVRLLLSTKTQPMVEVTKRFLTWENLGTGGAPTPAAYSYPQVPPTIGANGTRLAINGTDLCFATATLEIAQELAENECGGATEGTGSMSVTGRRVTLELVFLDDDLATIGVGSTTAPGSALAGPLQLDIATITPGRSASILIPAPVLLEQPTLQDLGGKLATRVLIGCKDYTGDNPSTAPGDTAARIAWL